MSQTVETPVESPPTQQAEPPRGRKRKLALPIVLALLLVGLALGLRSYLHSLVYESTDDAFIEAHVVPISARVPGHVEMVNVRDNQLVKKGDLLLKLDAAPYQAQLDQARAALAAARARNDAADTGVQLMDVTSKAAAQQAQAGVTAAEAGVETAQAQVAAASSKIDETQAGIDVAEAQAAQAQAAVAAAEAESTRSSADLKRYEELIQSKGISQQQLDFARAAAQSAASNLEAARKKAAADTAKVAQAKAARQAAGDALKQAQAALAQAQAGVTEAKARFASANTAAQQLAVSEAQAKTSAAEIARAQAAVRQAELDMAYTEVHAPADGRITRRSVEAGAYIQVGQNLLALVPQEVWVTANFKETQLTHMQPGQPAEIHVDAYPALKLKGHVDSIQSGTGSRFSLLPAENATGNYVKVVQRVPVKIVLDEQPDPQHPLSPGMSVVPEVKVK